MLLELEVLECYKPADNHDKMSFCSNGIYSSQYLCKVVNFRGISGPPFTSLLFGPPAIWSLKIPPEYISSFGFSPKTSF